MKKFLAIGTIILSLGVAAIACSKDDSKKDEPATPGTPAETTKTFTNPVFAKDSPDPSVMRGDDGYFYAFTTCGLRKSKDMVKWLEISWAFASGQGPKWSDVCHDVWAMDVNKIGDQYVLYYSLSKWGEGKKNGIGVATSKVIQGPYTDKGKMFTSEEIGVNNSIDAQYFKDDNGKQYLTWGSFNGIFAIELSDDGLSLREGASKFKIAGNWYEGSLVHKHGNYYYLFASIGSCCEGLNSTYTTVVGRSERFEGPYVNKSGQQMLNNKHEVLIKSNDMVKGPGHNSEIITDDNGQDWIFYHGYLVSNPKLNRVMFMDPVNWVDGWPEVKDQMPCMTKQPAPVFK